MLFSIMEAGKVTLPEAACFAGMGMEEAEDLLESWRMLREYEREREEGAV